MTAPGKATCTPFLRISMFDYCCEVPGVEPKDAEDVAGKAPCIFHATSPHLPDSAGVSHIRKVAWTAAQHDRQRPCGHSASLAFSSRSSIAMRAASTSSGEAMDTEPLCSISTLCVGGDTRSETRPATCIACTCTCAGIRS